MRISGWRSPPSCSRALIGTWQMWVRSPLGANVGTPGQYFMSVTAHGVSMAYVLTTFFIMGFGYFVAVTALNRPLPGRLWAWAAFWIALLGVVVTVIPIGAGPGFGPFHLLSAADGERLVLHRPGAGRRRIMDLVRPDARRDERMEAGESRPARAARNVRDGRQRGDVAVDDRRRGGRACVPGDSGRARTGRRPSTSALSRTLFSWTLHAIVYFWLIPGLHRLLHHGAARGRRHGSTATPWGA